ncbi:phage portal protein [Glutamicibacter nicotianae]|uniref:phage portal protein n=1 Tax=Glutamicibacter nicotianae TaxID=37929 RepID=UPI00255632D0|nr:phage portal protein [Glutamicibacter nicotianae]WIV44526.1 phage portal protein [Glutamicibacter nicotianae]
MSFESLRQQLPSTYQARKYDDYYDGKARLDALGVNIPPEVRVLELVAPFPRLAVDVLAEVLTFVGFTLGENSDDDRLAYLKRVFQVNRMDTAIRMAIIDALVQGGAFFIVGPGDPVPRITVHPRSAVTVDYDWMGRPTEALVRWRTSEDKLGRRMSHYTPGKINVYKYAQGQWVLDESQSRETGIDEITVVPMWNKSRITDFTGRSEMADTMKLADGASRTLTGMQLAQELEAMPKRWIFADGIAEALRASGQSKLEAYMGYLNLGPEGGKVQQLNGASLDPLISSFKLYAQIISAATGIPPSMLGITTDNPASAEAMRVAKERLSSKGEAKQSMFGDALEDLARLVLKVADKSVEGLESLETVWRDVATPSKSSQQSMALQAFQAGAIGARTMRDFLDLTPAQRQREDDRETAMTGTRQRTVTRANSGDAGSARSDPASVPASDPPSNADGTG